MAVRMGGVVVRRTMAYYVSISFCLYSCARWSWLRERQNNCRYYVDDEDRRR